MEDYIPFLAASLLVHDTSTPTMKLGIESSRHKMLSEATLAQLIEDLHMIISLGGTASTKGTGGKVGLM